MFYFTHDKQFWLMIGVLGRKSDVLSLKLKRDSWMEQYILL